jgi:hypothetical protein
MDMTLMTYVLLVGAELICSRLFPKPFPPPAGRIAGSSPLGLVARADLGRCLPGKGHGCVATIRHNPITLSLYKNHDIRRRMFGA